MKKYLLIIAALFAAACGSALDGDNSSVVISSFQADGLTENCIGENVTFTARVTTTEPSADLNVWWCGVRADDEGGGGGGSDEVLLTSEVIDVCGFDWNGDGNINGDEADSDDDDDAAECIQIPNPEPTGPDDLLIDFCENDMVAQTPKSVVNIAKGGTVQTISQGVVLGNNMQFPWEDPEDTTFEIILFVQDNLTGQRAPWETNGLPYQYKKQSATAMACGGD